MVIGPAITVRGSEVHIATTAALRNDPCSVLRVAALSAAADAAISREALDLLSANACSLPDPWPAEARQLLGRPAAGRPTGRSR